MTSTSTTLNAGQRVTVPEALLSVPVSSTAEIGVALVTSFTLSRTQAGSILATVVFLPISRLPEDQLLSWGWRVPFWLSIVVVFVGWLIRRTLDETPAFLEEKEHRVVPRAPLPVLFVTTCPTLGGWSWHASCRP